MQQGPDRGLGWMKMAEGEGFEPPDGCPSMVFKTIAFDHSATPPRRGATLRKPRPAGNAPGYPSGQAARNTVRPPARQPAETAAPCLDLQIRIF